MGRLVAEGRAKEFSSFRWAGEVPNPQELRTFERSKLDWSELAEPSHAELFDWHRRLIELRSRKSHRDRSRKARVKFDADARWLQFQHAGILALFNFADEPRQRAAAGRRLGLGIELGAGRRWGSLACFPPMGPGSIRGAWTGAAA